jgi:hypothetical protein
VHVGQEARNWDQDPRRNKWERAQNQC